MDNRWTDADLETLRRCYARYSTADLAFLLGRSAQACQLKARALGLAKAPETLVRFKKGHVSWNKGMKGWQAPGTEATQFKKGNQPHTTLPVGTLRVTKDGTLQRKIGTRSGSNSMRWRGVHELVWIAAHGPVPPGHIVVFKEPRLRTMVEADITLDKVECISLAENMRRNSVHTLPPELAALVQLRGALTRQINRAEREREGQGDEVD